MDCNLELQAKKQTKKELDQKKKTQTTKISTPQKNFYYLSP